jgi:5-methylcytosine-specific restriction endonuclease McrA
MPARGYLAPVTYLETVFEPALYKFRRVATLRRCVRCGVDRLRVYWPKGKNQLSVICRDCQEQKARAVAELKLVAPPSRRQTALSESRKRWNKVRAPNADARRNVVRERAEMKAAERAARKAWQWYLREGASDEWVAGYYEALGRPWVNRRLTEVARYALRYRFDPIFRQKEIHRQGNRKAVIAARDDGTVDFGPLYTERKRCPYCSTKLSFVNRVLDHMDPVSKGGAHSASNITVCCIPCNTRKGHKTFAHWLSLLNEQHRQRASKMYERKRRAAGLVPGQLVFDFFPGSFCGAAKGGQRARETRIGENGT